MLDFYLHGFGADGDSFRSAWGVAANTAQAVFLSGAEPDSFSGRRRWFQFSAQPAVLARGVSTAADVVEQQIAAVRAASGQDAGAISLTGHSQGAMVCLELLRRRPAHLTRVRSYCGFLPAPLRRPTLRAEASATVLEIYSSVQDDYIAPSEVAATVAYFRQCHGLAVRHLCSERLGHAFSADWLNATNFNETAVP